MTALLKKTLEQRRQALDLAHEVPNYKIIKRYGRNSEKERDLPSSRFACSTVLGPKSLRSCVLLYVDPDSDHDAGSCEILQVTCFERSNTHGDLSG